jgi:hypothetical protein
MNGQAMNWINEDVLLVSHKNSLKIINFERNSPIPEDGKVSELLL